MERSLDEAFEPFLKNSVFQEVLELVRQNSKGKIWVIGGFAYRNLAAALYGGKIYDYDIDFIVEEKNEILKEVPGWQIELNSYGNPNYVRLRSGMRPVQVFIEDIAYQAALPQYLEAMADMKVKGFKVPMDKRSKFAVLGDLIKAGKIIFPRKGCELLIEQLVGFGMELHDDLPDALALIAFAIFPNPYPRVTIPRRTSWPGANLQPLMPQEIKRLEHEEDLRIMRESDQNRRFG